MRTNVNDAQDNDINSYSQFLTLYHYASTASTLLVSGLAAAGATLALYNVAEMSGISVTATTVGIGILAIGLFAKKPVENFIAMCADYQSAYNEEENRENQPQM